MALDTDLSCDVLVIGSGAGGLSTAVTARKHGLDVVVVEKAPVFGGTTAFSGGVLWIPGNRRAPQDARDAIGNIGRDRNERTEKQCVSDRLTQRGRELRKLWELRRVRQQTYRFRIRDGAVSRDRKRTDETRGPRGRHERVEHSRQ